MIRSDTTLSMEKVEKKASVSSKDVIILIISFLLGFSFWTDARSLNAFVSFLGMETTMTNNNNSTIHSASSANNNNKTQSGPGLFFHVGPVKTGSTSIQCNLRVNPFLKESSYVYLGKDSKPLCPSSEFPAKKNFPLDGFIKRFWGGKLANRRKPKKYASKFTKMFQKKFQKGINSILSGEEVCLFLGLPSEAETEKYLQNFAYLMNGIPQQVTIQVVYRHFFEWSLSIYQYQELYSKGRTSNMEEKLMESIVDKSPKDNFLQKDPPKCSPYKLWRFLQDRMMPLLDRGKLEVFNFHGDGTHDIGTRYICSLPDAQVACQKTKEQVKLGRANPTNAGTLHADRIATAAWKQKLFQEQVPNKRARVRRIILDHITNDLNSTLTESQWECLSEEELATSLDLSIRIGNEMLGDSLDVEALKSKFLLDKSKKKFCSVNTTAVLEDPDWIDFLRDLTID